MEDIISILRNKSVHIVGVTGAEGSSILRFLIKHNLTDITVHDFLKAGTVAKSFRLWHKGVSTSEREKLLIQFESDLKSTVQKSGIHYLEDIDKADIIFVPQSWRLYKSENKKIFDIAGRIPFYTLTRLYLDYSPATIIGVTGTVGKGSTTSIIYQLLKKSLPTGRQIYFAGNETWMVQLADKLDGMGKSDILALEISHRQLLDGFSKSPHMVVITNIYPNHMDEVSWKDYQKLKLSLLDKQTKDDISILNYDIPQLRLRGKVKPEVIYFSKKNLEMNTKNVQRSYELISSTNSDHYLPNILAAYTVLDVLGINIDQLLKTDQKLKSLPGRIELINTVYGIKIYDDIKSTTPWATIAALGKLKGDTFLICGGETKSINYEKFVEVLAEKAKYVVAVKSVLSRQIGNKFPDKSYSESADLNEAIHIAYEKAKEGDNILISPGAGYFYTQFIRGKDAISKILTSLPPKEQV